MRKYMFSHAFNEKYYKNTSPSRSAHTSNATDFLCDMCEDGRLLSGGIVRDKYYLF